MLTTGTQRTSRYMVPPANAAEILHCVWQNRTDLEHVSDVVHVAATRRVEGLQHALQLRDRNARVHHLVRREEMREVPRNRGRNC